MDETSKIKTYRGAIIALTGAIAILILLLAYGIGINRALLGAFVAWLVPTGVNAGRQFMKGVPVELLDQITGGKME